MPRYSNDEPSPLTGIDPGALNRPDPGGGPVFKARAPECVGGW